MTTTLRSVFCDDLDKFQIVTDDLVKMSMSAKRRRETAITDDE